jgi:hypothetical protein
MPAPLTHAPELRGRSLAPPSGRSDTNACGAVEVEWNVRDEGKKLVMDFCAASGRGRVMEDDHDLLALLCTRIGTIMEDTSAIAITAAMMNSDERTRAIAQIADAVSRLGALTAAAVALSTLGPVASGHQ